MSHTSSSNFRLILTGGLALLTLGLSQAQAQAQIQPAAPAPLARLAAEPAIDGVLAAFSLRPIVALSDYHGIAQQMDFYGALIRDPRFAKQVGNVVVEFGTAAHQDIIDDYVNGKDVPYAELRKVWADPVGWSPYAGNLGFANFYAQVRAVNLTLSPEQRIKVWLGDPPIDWSRIQTSADLGPIQITRDSHAGDLVLKEILGRNKKALVIYGGAHLSRAQKAAPATRTTPAPGAEAAMTKIARMLAGGEPDYSLPGDRATRIRGSLKEIQAQYAPLGPLESVKFQGVDPGDVDRFDVTFAKGVEHWRVLLNSAGEVNMLAKTDQPYSVLVDYVEAQRPNSFFVVGLYNGYAQKTCSEAFEQRNHWTTPMLVTTDGPSFDNPAPAQGCTDGLWADARATQAILYLTPAADLMASPTNPEFYLDTAFRQEITRRSVIKNGQAYRPINMEEYKLTQSKWRNY